MIYMNCDYNEGAHEQVLARIVQTNAEQTAGYCLDPYCAEAAALIRRLCDAFYSGAAKNGALFGETVVLCHPALAEGFRSIVRRKGALLAKGRLLGVQFLALLEDGLYQRIARRANRMADRIRSALLEMELPIVSQSTTNLIFTILPDACYDRLKQEFKVAYQHRTDESHCLVRRCTSWATREEAVDRLCALLREAMA